MAIPKPGKPVRGSTTGSPVMAIFDLLGRRWAMGIVWQLSSGPLAFNVLQSRCSSISPTILSTRIKDLIEAGVIERSLDGYQLTKTGRELFTILEPFQDWAIKWAKSLKNSSG
ncbi:MAG: transcriptional regulator [Spirochaetes bacterium]|nr:MAG: transcriptional regulator [Spirochaetota bacterium]